MSYKIATSEGEKDLGNMMDGVNSQLFEIKTKIIINVQDYGAKGDGITDDTQACKNAFDFAKTIENIPKIIVFPFSETPYMIDGTSLQSSDGSYSPLRIPSNTVIDMCCSTLKIIPNTEPSSAIFRAINKKNILIKNGVMYGDYVEPVVKSGEWQFGIAIDTCNNISIDNVKIYNMRGDGICLGDSGDATIKNESILISNCYIDTVHRNGISVTSGKNIIIQNTKIYHTTGNVSGCGIDFEPNLLGIQYYIEDVMVHDCIFENINGPAINFIHSMNSKLFNNSINNAIEGLRIQASFEIEITKNIYKNISGIWISGDSTDGVGNFYFTKNTIENFNNIPPTGYSGYHIPLISRYGNNGIIYFDNNVIKKTVGDSGLLEIDGFAEIIENHFSEFAGRLLLSSNTSNVKFYSNLIADYSSNLLFTGTNSSITKIRNNVIIGIPMNINKYDDAIFSTDILDVKPTMGSYNKGEFVKNNYYSSFSNTGWLCTASGVACGISWTSNSTYSVGTYVYANNKVYKCVTAGTSGAVAPSHTSGDANDGTVTWTYVDTLATFNTCSLTLS